MSDWPIQITSAISWLSLVLAIACVLLCSLCLKIKADNRRILKSVHFLENQLRAMSSGHLGMGREIKRVAKEMANVEELKSSELSDGKNEKTYEQAGLLLARGATIEEVVAACEITPAEAELIAIMSHSAPAHVRHPSNAVTI